MKLRVVKIGRIAYPEIRSLAEVYISRTPPLARPVVVESLEVKDEGALPRTLQLSEHSNMVVCIDEKGQPLTSPEMAARIQTFGADPAIKAVTLLIGGPMGLSRELRGTAKASWSLSRLTFTSDLAWLLVWEQLYRSFNIIKGTSYHHE